MENNKPKNPGSQNEQGSKDKAKIQKSVFKTKSVNKLLEDARKEPPPRKLVGELIYEEEQTILFAPTNLGKSILAIQMAISAALGIDLDLGNGLILKNEVGKVTTLIYDFELSDRQFLKRMGNKILPDNLFISKIERGKVLNGTPKQIFELLKKEAKSVNAKFIIVDNISKIGNKLEDTDNAIDFMSALWNLARHDGYTILVIAHTPKINRKEPITSDSIAGSSKLAALSDSIIGMNEFNSHKESQIYIKQIKTRNDSIKYGKSKVICTNITMDSDGFVKHDMFALSSEYEALHGNRGSNTESLQEKMYATASYYYYGTYKNAAIETGIDKSTLNRRKKSLETMSNQEFKQIAKMDKKELLKTLKLYRPDEDDPDQTELKV